MTRRPSNPPSREIKVKVYLVFQRNFASRGDKPNTRLLCAKLVWRDAKKVVDAIPGTFIQKVYATKDLNLPDNSQLGENNGR